MTFSLPRLALLESLTEEELDAVTVVFHQYETGLREGTIYTKVTAPYQTSWEQR